MYEEMKSIFEEDSMKIRESLSNDEEFNGRTSEYDQSTTNKENFLGLKWIHDIDVMRSTLKPWVGKNYLIRCFALRSIGFLTAYALNQKNQGTESNSFLINAKSRNAPMKGVSIPRLELLPILIGVRAAQFVLKQLEMNENQVTL
ncbi:unnamed protein product [Onchocerca ochengi]|uniref:DUF3403 domain-containing protein n=1 Tax=Onchocerca ochengi TaxID=42157 RepID=A0A182EVX4_ONCOC|nr:unnamed protein product [Onchocerca ochengi]